MYENSDSQSSKEQTMEQLKALIHYIIYQAEQKKSEGFRSSVRLNKSILYANVEVAKKTGKPLVDLIYIKKPEGPICKDYRIALKQLEKEGKIAIKAMPILRKNAKKNKRISSVEWLYTSLNTPCLNTLSGDIVFAKEILAKFVAMKPSDIAKYSHEYGEGHGANWVYSNNDDIIPFESYLIEQDMTEEDIAWMAAELSLMSVDEMVHV